MPLFDNPLHKGKGLSGSGSQSNGNNDSQNDYDNPPVLGYYYGDDDELYFYSNDDYYGNSYVSDDYDNLLSLVTFDHDDNDYAYPINAPYGLAYYTNKNEQNSESSWWDTGKYLTPIYGDWLSFKEAESGWDYALAVVGIVPSPWTKGAKGVNVANKARKAVNKAGNSIEINNPVLNNIRTGSALKKDELHAFNNIIDNYAGQATKFSLKGGDGIERSLYQVEGSLNGKSGVFEWIVDPNPAKGVVHRRFIENVPVTGKPNATPAKGK